tara:strand:- start:980 stop:2563 length:1584 start_codon:yes stop_codon:yes gene_type:complete
MFIEFMNKFFYLARGLFKDQSLRSNSLLIGGLPLIIFLIICGINIQLAKNITEFGKQLAISNFGSIWLLMVVGVSIVAFFLGFSPLGSLKIGGPEAKTSLKFFDWCAVLICTLLAGGGVFWSAAEPLIHFLNPASYFTEINGGTSEAVDPSLAVSFLHWGFLAWALVATTVTITFSLISQKGLPLRPRSLLIPICPKSTVDGFVGDLADGLSVVAAIAGTVGPLGFLSLQLSNAAGKLSFVNDSAFIQTIIVIFLTTIFTISTLNGIQKGIKFLSEINIWLTIILGVLLFFVGPTLWLLQHFLSSNIFYLSKIKEMALPSFNNSWVKGWTVFYWAWFLGYAPLMGLFTAGVSKGRTFRELIIVVCVICPFITNLWFTILGGNGIYLELNNPTLISNELAKSGSAGVLFATLSQLPFSFLLIFLAIILIILFMCTSADSISYAAAIVVSGQDTPPKRVRLFWALMIGFLTIALLRIGSGVGDSTSIDALQAFIVITAVPVTPLIISTLWTAPKLALKEYQRLKTLEDK